MPTFHALVRAVRPLLAGGVLASTLGLLAVILLTQVPSASAESPCGGENQRSCCFNAQEGIGSRCREGDDPLYPLVAIPGCGIECECAGVGVSAFTCVQPTECGGPGQRACCAEEERRDQLGGPCEPDLEQIKGCVGDCFCREGAIYESNHTCVPINPSSQVTTTEGTTGWTAPEDLFPPQPGRSCPLLGYADIHAHLMSHLAHGGGVFYGEPAPVDPATGLFTLDPGLRDIKTALDNAGDGALHAKHRLIGAPPYDPTGNGTNDITGGSATDPIGRDGWPTFSHWPHWTSTTHQQMYYKWLERAWRGGMRLMVQLAVTNEALCIVSGVDDNTCEDSMDSVDAQIAATYDFERFIDEQYGSEFSDGGGWFKIVDDPMEAREAIRDGKMAVVLGIEMDNLFNCKEGQPCPNVSAKTVNDCLAIDPTDEANAHLRRGLPAGSTLAQTVDWYHDCYGVRHVFPIHNFDNAFGATATWQNAINVGQRAAVGRWQNADSGHDTDDGNSCEEQGQFGYGFDFDRFTIGVIAGIGFEDLTPIPVWPGQSVCNTGGLNLTASDRDGRGLAADLLDRLMDKGMIIDVDHMSIKAFDQTIEFAEDRFGDGGYPLVASHVQSFDLHGPEFNSNDAIRTFGRHERMRTRLQLAKIRASGGMIAAMTKDDQQDGDDAGLKVNVPYLSPFTDPTDLTDGFIPDACRHSSRTFGQAYQYAVDQMGGPVALGIDFNGIAGHVGPRFGSEACGNHFDRTLEQAVREDERSLEILLSVIPAESQPQLPFKVPTKLDYDETPAGFTLEGFGAFARQQSGTSADNAAGESLPLRTWDFNVDGLAHAGLLPDLVADLKTLGMGQRYLDMLFGSAEEYIRVWEKSRNVAGVSPLPELSADLTCGFEFCEGGDTIGPRIGCTDVVRECEGVLTTVSFAPEVGEDHCGGVVASQGCSTPSPITFGTGSLTTLCTATDDSGNESSCSLHITVRDTTPPFSLTPPPDLPEVQCTSPLGTSPVLGSATAADLCDLDPELFNDAPGVFPLGATTVVWGARDDAGNKTLASQSVTVVDTIPPAIECPADIEAECTGNHQATATPGAASGSDICSTSVSLTTHPTQAFDLGVNELMYTATDAQGNQSHCSSNVTIVDETAPTIELVAATPSRLWPPNNKMVPVTVNVDSGDICDTRTPVCTITGITSNEPSGDGELDWRITGPLTAKLRKQRSGSGDDRVYTIEVSCMDEAENTTTDSTTVTVPHNRTRGEGRRSRPR